MMKLATRAFAALALSACAVSAAKTYPQVAGPGGARVAPAPAAITGLDSSSGAVCVVGSSSTCAVPTGLNSPLPPGSNTIGAVSGVETLGAAATGGGLRMMGVYTPGVATASGQAVDIDTDGGGRIILSPSSQMLRSAGFAILNAAALAASATSTPTYRPASSYAWASYYGCRATASQAFSVSIMETLGGGSGIAVSAQSGAAGQVIELAVRLRGAADTYACTVTNTNATAGTATAADGFTAS